MRAQFSKYTADSKACFLIREEWARYKKGNIQVRTLGDLEQVLGIGNGIMAQYLSGHKKMNIEMILKLASVFGCTPYDLDQDFPRWVEGTFY